MKYPFSLTDVKARYNEWPKALRDPLLHLRDLVFNVADATKGVGEIEETLKWNVPSYLTHNPKSGTTIRLGPGRSEDQYGLFVHCQTTLISTFREMYPREFSYEKNRAILFGINDEIAEEELRHCISMALTYHLKN